MKFQKFLLPTLLAFQSINTHSINKLDKIFNYNFHCIKDNNDICSKLHKKLNNAINSLSRILDETSKVNFEVFVDDVSKYRIDRTKDTLALVLDTNFAPLNPNNNNTISPYPNAKTLKRKLNNKEIKDKDFILLLNNCKSNKKFLKNLRDDQSTLITVEIFEGLLNLNKLPYPYSGVTREVSFNLDSDEMANNLLNSRKDPESINSMSVYFEDKCIKYSAANKLPEAIQWKDTLISKGKEQFPRKKYKYRRIVALGDIHGDYNKLESILRHAKLIDKNNDWIGTDSILVQIGDLTDRGPNFKDVVELFIKIRKQAQKKGGIVYMLLGNHELYDMQAGYFMILKSDFDSFGGYLEREKAISMEGKYGELLRKEMNLTMVVDDNLFVHSFLNYRFAKRGLNELNKHVKDILSNVPSFDELLEDYYNQNKTHPIYTDPIFDMTNGPLWSREYIDIPEEEVCEELEKVLKIAKSKRMIIGHTVQEYGKIQTKCQDKLILIDLGLSTCLGNYFGYLEILNNKREIWARYQTKKN